MKKYLNIRTQEGKELFYKNCLLEASSFGDILSSEILDDLYLKLYDLPIMISDTLKFKGKSFVGMQSQYNLPKELSKIISSEIFGLNTPVIIKYIYYTIEGDLVRYRYHCFYAKDKELEMLYNISNRDLNFNKLLV